MNLITLDFETFYGKGYSLSKLTTEEYIRHPNFQTLMAGIKINDEPAQAYLADEHDLQLVFDALDIENSMVLCHHTHFDLAILNWRYGHRPKIILDTLPMGRAAAGAVATAGGSLKALCTYFGLGTKGDIVMEMADKRLADLTFEDRLRYAAYCATSEDSDVNLTYRLAMKLLPQFTRTDLQMIDFTTRFFTEPLLELDGPLYAEYKELEIARKATLILQAGVTKDELMSADKFAQVLIKMGVPVPLKPSPKRKDENGRPIMVPAFAKTDDGLKDLLEHPNEFIRAVVEARMGVKTSINETRALRFMGMADRGACPIYVKYWGAEQTGRHSAGDKTNFLNLGRSKLLTPSHLTMGTTIVTPAGRAQVAKLARDGKRVLTTTGVHAVKDCHQIGLRDGLRAPPGYKIVLGDSSNIEARGVVVLAGQDDMVEAYRQGKDLYSALAEDVFRRPITKNDNPGERQMGKVGVLLLGFGGGKNRFDEMVRAWDFGPDKEMMRPYQENRPLLDSIVDVFRNKYYNVVGTWRDYTERVIPALSARECVYLDRKCLIQTTERGTILLPTGRELRYPHIRWKEFTPEEMAMGYGQRRGGEWVFDVRESKRLIPTRIYGAKLFENVVQALCTGCGGITMQQAVKISRRYRVVLVGYDEVVCCVREELAQECEAYIKEVLSTPPEWALDFPVAAETGIGDFYGAAK